MECIKATSLHRKSGQWGTQHLLLVWGEVRLANLGQPSYPYLAIREAVTILVRAS
jgi:hypothetical protein